MKEVEGLANFNTDFSILRLLSSQPITGYIGDIEFKIIPPKLLDYYNASFSFLLSILEKDVDEIKNIIVGQKLDNHYLLFSFILAGVDKTEDVVKLGILILSGLQLIVPDLVFEDKMFKIKGEFISEQTFNQFILIFFKMLKKDKIMINPTDDKFTKKEKEMKMKVQRIKRNANKNGSKGNSMEDMLAAILYEFPQYTLEDLFELNIYTIYYLFGYVGKIANYEVSKIAAGNGNLKKSKKHKYFIEK